MADTINILDATGATKTIATDDVGAGHHQSFKVMQGADGSADGWTGELLPFPTRPIIREIAVTSAGLDNAAYAAGDQLGDLFTFANAARASGGGGFLVGAQLIDASNGVGLVDLVIYKASVTLGADNAAYSISAADTLKVVCVIPLAGPYAMGNARFLQSPSMSFPFVCSGGTSLYGSLISRGTTAAFPAATNIQVNIQVQN